MSTLKEYKRKRDFKATPEPGPEKKSSDSGNLFVIQKHRATALHYDFRLEYRGVLKSWAVPKGPALDPAIKRLAMEVEDHPLDYAFFEGVIPEGEYGGGTVMIWDIGTYTPEADFGRGFHKGELKFTMHGQKLKGSWALVRTDGRRWLLIKHRDKHVSAEDITLTSPVSIATKRTLAEIAEDEGGNVAKAATADPKKIPRRTGVKRRTPRARRKVWRTNRAS
jgi:bifunctional non-homologous end joining protein LigD